jgi:nitrite reductase (NADH) small subunit
MSGVTREYHSIAKASDIKEDLQPLILDLGRESIAVYRYKGKYYAYANRCPHQGGPSSEGTVIGNTEAAVETGGTQRQFVSKENFNIACPWHGIEFSLETGLCTGTPRLRLKLYPLIKDGDDLKLAVEAGSKSVSI